MQEFEFSQPNQLSELGELLRQPGRRIIAGGTDLLPRLKRNHTDDEALVDLSHLPELQELRQSDTEIWIGAMLTHARLASSTLIQNQVPALAHSCSLVGCRQTRYRGTIGGNLANASPAADTAPILLARSASLTIQSADNCRTLSIEHFFVSPGKTCLASSEYLASIQIPLPGRFWGEGYFKLGQRKGMSIAVASIAVHLELDANQMITLARVAAGSVAPTPIRCLAVEEALQGKVADESSIRLAAEKITENISPIDDIRASREYRLRLSKELASRAITSAVMQAKARMS